MNQLHIKSEKLLCGVAFTFFALITVHKLTNASLWFDETVEYWYSKIMIGSLPFDNTDAYGSNMYQRIILTFQPPLYNFLMYFWLKISDSEWWFRFFGVIMGFLGMIALYKTIGKIGNLFLASLAVIFGTCIYRLVYYWQECAEYCLMLGTLFWTIYCWFRMIEKPEKKFIICFTISAILPIYSQYGAVFPVVVMTISAFIYIILIKEWKAVKIFIISDTIALFTAALPLYCFFLKKQMIRQRGGAVLLNNITFSQGIFKDMIHHFRVVLRWNFFSHYSDASIRIFLVIIFTMTIAVFVLSHNKVAKLFIITNIVVWLLYYFSVKSGIYAYGNFENRYNLFFIPMWIVMLFLIGIEFFSVLSQHIPEKFEVKWQYTGICICFLLCYSYFEWDSVLQHNWEKENCRDIVNEWYAANATDSNTIVYQAANTGFSYYVRQNSKYNETTEDNVNYMYRYVNKSIDGYKEYINSIYGDNWPDEIYLAATHTGGEHNMNTLISSITTTGYDREDIYSNNAYLIRLTRK